MGGYPAVRYHDEARQRGMARASQQPPALEAGSGDGLEMFAPLGMRRPAETSLDDLERSLIDPQPSMIGGHVLSALAKVGRIIDNIRKL